MPEYGRCRGISPESFPYPAVRSRKISQYSNKKGELPELCCIIGKRQREMPMLFDEMAQIARNVASQRISSNMPLTFNDTICVVSTSRNKTYVGVSAAKIVNNMPMFCHAEMEVCNILLNENDTVIKEMSLFNAGNFQPVLPCPDCAARIMGLDPANAGTLLLLPTQSVILSQLGVFVQSQQGGGQGMPQPGGAMGMPMNPNQGFAPQFGAFQGMPPQNVNTYQGMPQQTYTPPPANAAYHSGEDTDSGSYLKNRLNKLFDVEDELEPEEEKPAPKKKFKLF